MENAEEVAESLGLEAAECELLAKLGNFASQLRSVESYRTSPMSPRVVTSEAK